MNKHDIRLIDTDDPQTPTALLKEIKKATTDAGDKYETFVVTHEPINLKAKLTLKNRTAASQANEEGEIINQASKDQIDD